MPSHKKARRPSSPPSSNRDCHWTPSSTNSPASACRVPNGSRPVHPALEPDVAEMFDDHRHVLDRTQQIRIVEQFVPIHVQPRVPAELTQPRHRAPDVRLALIEGKKADEVKTSAAHTGHVHALQLLV